MTDGLGMEARAKPPETSFAGAGKLAGGLQPLLAPNIPDTSGPGPVALQEPAHWVYDFDPATGTSRASFNGEVTFLTGGSATAGVTSWNGQTGAVVMLSTDIIAAGGLANPSVALTGVPTAPTASPGTSTAQLATTQFVGAALAAGAGVTSFNARQGAVTLSTADVMAAGGAPLSSPALTGTPTAPTASQGDVSNQVATNAFVSNAIAGGTVTGFNGRRGAVSLTLSDVMSVGGAPVASPTFTGVPAVPTANPGTSTAQAASTAFVTNAVAGSVVGVSSFNTRTGAVVFTPADLANVGGAPLNAPTFTGQAHAPTPSAGDNSTLIATTAYVETALGGLPPGVATWNGRQGAVTLLLSDVTSVGGAPLASPTFTGSPLTTTPPPADNSTRIADTAFVAAAIGALPAVPPASNALPHMNGTATAGVDTAYSRDDHVHPTDTSLYPASNPAGFQTAGQVSASLANYLPLSGGGLSGGLTVSGPLQVNNTITSNNRVAALGYQSRQGTSGVTTSSYFNIYWTNSTANLYIDATFIGQFAWASDYRLKKDVAPLAGMWERTKALRPVSYTRRAFGALFTADEVEHWGFLAHELQDTLTTSAASGEKDGPDVQSPDPWTVIAALTRTLQEAMERIEALEIKAA